MQHRCICKDAHKIPRSQVHRMLQSIVVATILQKVVKDRMGERHFFDLDEEMWCEVEDAIQLKRIVHFITDDKAYSYRAYELFHDRINYGLHWDHLADTKEVLCKRSTKFQDAIDDFAIMQKCTLVYGHKSSSICGANVRWIYPLRGSKLCGFSSLVQQSESRHYRCCG